MKKIIPLFIILFSLTFISALSIPNKIPVQIQVEEYGAILTGTFNFTLNVTTNSDCSGVIYTNMTQHTTDWRGIVNYTIDNFNINPPNSNLYLCYYRDGVLIMSRQIASSIFSIFAQNTTWEGVINKPVNLSQFVNNLNFINITDGNFTGLINNASYLSTYNATYDAWSYNQTIASNNSIFGAYGQYFYNMSSNTMDHNLLVGLDGGDGTNYYHLGLTEYGQVIAGIGSWITNNVTNLLYYYNKTEVYNISEIEGNLTGFLKINSIITTDNINKTSGTNYVGDDLTSIIDAIVTITNDLDIDKLDITDQRFNETGSVTGVNASLNTHISNQTNPHQVTYTQIGAGGLTGNNVWTGNNTFYGNQSFYDLRLEYNPTLDNHAVRKAYVDALVLGLTWKDPVILVNISTNNSEEIGSLITGDRYVVNPPGSGNWTGWDNYIAQWTGTAWDFDSKPQTGWTILELNTNKQWRFDNVTNEWVQIGAVTSYTAGTGLLLTGTEFTFDLLTNGGLNLSGNKVGISYNNSIFDLSGGKLNIKQEGINTTHIANYSIPDFKLQQIITANKVNWSAINYSNSKIDGIETGDSSGQVWTWDSTLGHGIWLTPNSSVSNASTLTIEHTMHSHPGSNVAWNITSAKTEFYGNSYVGRVRADLSSAIYYRITLVKASTATVNTTLNVEYSLNNGTSWNTLNSSAGGGDFNINNTRCGTTGACYSDWAIVRPEAKRDVLLRVVGRNGGSINVNFRQMAVQFQVPLSGNWNITYSTIGSGVSAMINLTDVINMSGNFYANSYVPIGNGSKYIVRQLNTTDFGDINPTQKENSKCLVFDNATQKHIYMPCMNNDISTVNYTTSGFDIVSYPGINFAITVGGEKEISVETRKQTDLTNIIQFRIYTLLRSGASYYGSPNQSIYVQYNNSNTGYRWYNLSIENGVLSINATGAVNPRYSSWFNLPASARTDSLLRFVNIGQNGTAIPYYRQLRIEFRVVGLNSSVSGVPYVGAEYNVDLGSFNLTANMITTNNLNITNGNLYLENNSIITRSGTNTSIGISSKGTIVVRL